MPKVSIIVPVYKVEKYLERCVESLRNQTLQDIEIILVDDGSPDSSPTICDTYAAQDNRIIVVHKENGGLSSARNAGMTKATGEYVGFVDSDDSVDAEMFFRMYTVAVMEKVDFVMCDYFRITQQGDKISKTKKIRFGRYNKAEIIDEIYPQLILGNDLDYGPLLSVWCCLYKREFLQKYKLRFEEKVRYSEDNLFNSTAGYYADSFYYLKNECYYHYMENQSTISTSYHEDGWRVYCLMNQLLRNIFENDTSCDFTRQLDLHLIYYACSSLNSIKRSTMSQIKKIDSMRSIMHDNKLQAVFKKFCFDPMWPLGLKAQLLLIKFKFAVLYLLQ